MISRRFFLGASTAALAAAQRPSPIQDADAHGDPPFLLEDGWTPLLNGRDLAGWRAQEGQAAQQNASQKNEWFTSESVFYDRLLAPTRLGGKPAPSGVILNGPTGRTVNLVSDVRHGDTELYLEFMLSKGSNSGVYLQGLYEIQLFDSYGSTEPMKTSDGGGIYHRWIDNKGIGGSAPRVNASRAPGHWQSYQAWFRAPRFDATGHKISNARFLKVLHNGVAVQENVEVEGPTRAHVAIPEAPMNPLMLQGDHGPVAFRNIYVRPLRPIISR